MRHRKALRKLGRTTAHRKALLRNLSTSFFREERITTTLPKAKELRPYAEKLITMARQDTLHSRRLVARKIADKTVVKKLFDTLAPRFAQRNGGYSRILKLGWRPGDCAEMAILELLGSEPVFKKEDPKKSKAKKKKAAADSTADTKKAKGAVAAETSEGAKAAPAKKAGRQKESAPKGKKEASSAEAETQESKTEKE